MKQEWKPFPRPCRINELITYQGKRNKVWMASFSESDIFIMDTDVSHLWLPLTSALLLTSLQSAQILHIVNLEDKNRPSALSQVGDTMWVGLHSGVINVYASTTLLLSSWNAHHLAVQSIATVPKSETVWTCAGGQISLWTFHDRSIQSLRTIEVDESIRQLSYIPGLNSLWCMAQSNATTIWDTLVTSPVQEITVTKEEENKAIMRAHDNFLVTLCGRHRLSKWSISPSKDSEFRKSA